MYRFARRRKFLVRFHAMFSPEHLRRLAATFEFSIVGRRPASRRHEPHLNRWTGCFDWRTWASLIPRAYGDAR